jgi:hypothetical protein
MESAAVRIEDIRRVVEIGVGAGVAVVHVADGHDFVDSVSVDIHDIGRSMRKIGPRSRLLVARPPSPRLKLEIHIGRHLRPEVHIVPGVSVIHRVRGKLGAVGLVGGKGDGV